MYNWYTHVRKYEKESEKMEKTLEKSYSQEAYALNREKMIKKYKARVYQFIESANASTLKSKSSARSIYGLDYGDSVNDKSQKRYQRNSLLSIKTRKPPFSSARTSITGKSLDQSRERIIQTRNHIRTYYRSMASICINNTGDDDDIYLGKTEEFLASIGIKRKKPDYVALAKQVLKKLDIIKQKSIKSLPNNTGGQKRRWGNKTNRRYNSYC